MSSTKTSTSNCKRSTNSFYKFLVHQVPLKIHILNPHFSHHFIETFYHVYSVKDIKQSDRNETIHTARPFLGSQIFRFSQGWGKCLHTELPLLLTSFRSWCLNLECHHHLWLEQILKLLADPAVGSWKHIYNLSSIEGTGIFSLIQIIV